VQEKVIKKKGKVMKAKDELEVEYDFSKLKLKGQGLYASRYKEGTNIILLEPDVAKVFHSDKSVNEALRTFIKSLPEQIHAN